jgi:hypothetical protein
MKIKIWSILLPLLLSPLIVQADSQLLSSSLKSGIVNQQAVLNELLPKLNKQKIVSTIKYLEGFGNRSHSSDEGGKASKWLHATWGAL